MNAPKIESLSIGELRAELTARSNLLAGLEKTLARVAAIREPRPDLKDISSDEIVTKIRDRQKVVYGEDDRVDIFTVTESQVIQNADGVAAIFRANDVLDNGDGMVSLPTKTLAAEFADQDTPLCGDEPFQNQPAGAICTAFLIGSDVVATAGHCLNENNLHTRRFVFGYRMESESEARTTVPASDVYQGLEVLGWELDNDGPDWTVVKLDRAVEGRQVLDIRKAGKVSDGTALYVIGHPVGLPQKYAGNAEVRVNQNESFFIANLDTFGGNSGSPVFNKTTHEVEGILVRGETDFAPKGNCLVSLLCPVQGCRGEDCTRITLIQPTQEDPS